MASDPLWGLLYESTATRPMTDEDLRAILAVSQRWNARAGITGWLTYAVGEDGVGRFTQYLEGPRSAVRALFYGEDGRPGVLRDARHRDVRVVHEGAFGGGPPGARLYPQWRMAWVEEPPPLRPDPTP